MNETLEQLATITGAIVWLGIGVPGVCLGVVYICAHLFCLLLRLCVWVNNEIERIKGEL